MAWQIWPKTGQINTRQHHFLNTVVGQAFNLLDDLANGGATAVSAPKGYGAKGAAMITALLHLNKSAGMFDESVKQMTSGLINSHDILNLNRRMLTIAPGVCIQFFNVADDPRNFRHRRKFVRINLGGTASNNDFCTWVFASSATNGLPSLSLGLSRHRTGVDDNALCAGRVFIQMVLDDFRFIQVQAATQRDDAVRIASPVSHGR